MSVSISHAEAHALCAAAWDEGSDGSRRMVGIDLCAIEPRSPELVATFFVDDERRYVRDAPPWERDARANLVWCAKEAVLKAFGVGLTVDTYALCCLPAPGVADPAEWPLAPADHRWRPFVAACAPPLAPEGEQVRGIWRAFGAFVAALATVRRRDTPAAAGHGPRA